MRLVVASIAILALAFTVPPGPKKGSMAPKFEITSPSGKTLKLSKLKGKVVLIDFWASWCRPCRLENPNVVEAYNKYHRMKFENGKSFEVFSISLDKNEEAWKAAIEKDGLSWKYHGWDKGGEVSTKYGVSSIPTAFLVDGTGKIVASGRELRGLGLHIQLDALLKQ